MLLLFAFILSGQARASEEEQLYTIYLVRHAEKQHSDSKDPALTVCGKERAAELAKILSAVELQYVYSSGYTRTLDTARPTAASQRLEIFHYDPRKLEELASTLKAGKRDAMVVGHSNTTAVLAGLLVGEQLAEFDESIYDRIYQVVLSGSGGRIHILHQAFKCSQVKAELN